jgi:hypothetical protein
MLKKKTLRIPEFSKRFLLPPANLDCPDEKMIFLDITICPNSTRLTQGMWTNLFEQFINKYQQDATPQNFLFPVLSISTCFGHVPCPSSGDQIN